MIETTGPGALARGRAAFAARFGGAGEVVARAPGRVNLIGEHVDYNDGFVLPAAIDRDVVVIARPVAGSRIHVLASDLGEEAAFHIERTRTDEMPAWARYLAGVAGALHEAGVTLTGAELAVAGDVPRGAGLASSAALEVATATALLALARTTLPPNEVIDLCRRAEHDRVGVQCGLMDQYASVHGRTDHALLLDCRAAVHRAVALPDRLRMVAIDGGIDRKLDGSAYNQRVRECQEAAAALGVASLRDIHIATFAERAQLLDERLRRRARHVITEISRTLEAVGAIDRGDLGHLAALIDDSHASLRDDFEVSTPELDLLADIARDIDGVYGSRLMGGGFGGCVLALVQTDAVTRFRRTVQVAYARRTGRDGSAFVLRAGPGASLIGRSSDHNI